MITGGKEKYIFIEKIREQESNYTNEQSVSQLFISGQHNIMVTGSLSHFSSYFSEREQ